ncbi:MAG: tetratricopeptide repeat protein, partial [Pyrinomonadaceae bacterium]
SVHGVPMTESELAALNAADTTVREEAKQASGGNRFVRAFTAPFRALGRLFGGGKKNNDKLQRLSKKDIEKFESTPADPLKVSTTAAVKARANSADDVQTNNADSHLQKGHDLLDSGSLNEAIAELSVAASINPNSAEANNLLGIAYEQKGLRERALRSFELAVRSNDDEPEYLNNLGYLLFKNGEYESATKHLKRAAKLAPDNPRIWNNLGLAQCERGHFDDAYKSFARALGEFKGHLNIATRLESLGHNKDAIKHLEKAFALKPNSTAVLVRLIALYDNTGKQDQAQSARRSLVALRTLAEATVQ